MTQRGWATMGKILLAVVVLIVIAIIAAILSVIQRGASARLPPTDVESVLARSMRHLAVPLSARSLRNPLPLTPEILRQGRDHFADHCATCHANDGSGKTEMGPNFY